MRITHRNTHIKKVDGHLIVRFRHQFLPAQLIPMRMVYQQKISLGSMQFDCANLMLGDNPVMMLQSPYHGLKASLWTPLCTREKHLGVKPIDKRGVQVKLRLGA